MRRSLFAALFVAAALAAIPATGSHAAVATRCADSFPLHAGSCGQLVQDLQWEIHSPRPKQNVFHEIKGTFKWTPNGAFGARTKSALVAWKYRAGYPKVNECGAKTTLLVPSATRWFFRLVAGKVKRPPCWVALAAARVRAVNSGVSPLAAKAKAYELHLLALNIHEIPDGSNRGPAISYPAFGVPALQSATRAYGLAWCVSTQETVMEAIGYGTFAGDTAGVYAAVDYAAARNWLHAKPKVGALVAFIDYDNAGQRIPGTGHMGFVSKTEANSFTYIAGNDRNAVREHTIADGSRHYAFIYLPGLA